jgi:hypothetical protein
MMLWSSLSMTAAADDAAATCHGLEDDAARLACYDRVTHRGAPLPLPSSLPGPLASPPPATPSQPDERSAAPRAEVPHTTQAPAPSTRGLRQPAQAAEAVVGAQIVEIITTSIGRYRFRLDNGEVWEQVEPGRNTLRAGDTVDLRPSALGAWQMRASGGTSRSMKVRRVQ